MAKGIKMDQRKLIRLGNSSFAIALPKDWVDKAGLKKGDNIFITPNSNGELLIQPTPTKEANNKTALIDTENKKLNEIKNEIRVAYIKGYGLLQINGVKSKQDKDEIKKILKDFLSFEIINSDEKGLLVKDFFDLEDVKIANFIRRMDNNIKEIFDITAEEIKKDKIDLQKIKEAERIDEDVNKFYFLCSRIFMRGIDNPTTLSVLKTNSARLFNEWWIAFNLEALSDNIKYFLRGLQENNNKKLKQKIIETFLEHYEAYQTCMEAFYKESSSLALQTINMTTKLRGKLNELIKENPSSSMALKELDQIGKQIYQNAKMTLYLKY